MEIRTLVANAETQIKRSKEPSVPQYQQQREARVAYGSGDTGPEMQYSKSITSEQRDAVSLVATPIQRNSCIVPGMLPIAEDINKNNIADGEICIGVKSSRGKANDRQVYNYKQKAKTHLEEMPGIMDLERQNNESSSKTPLLDSRNDTGSPMVDSGLRNQTPPTVDHLGSKVTSPAQGAQNFEEYAKEAQTAAIVLKTANIGEAQGENQAPVQSIFDDKGYTRNTGMENMNRNLTSSQRDMTDEQRLLKNQTTQFQNQALIQGLMDTSQVSSEHRNKQGRVFIQAGRTKRSVFSSHNNVYIDPHSTQGDLDFTLHCDNQQQLASLQHQLENNAALQAENQQYLEYLKNQSQQQINLHLPAADAGFYESQHGLNDQDTADMADGRRVNAREILAQLARDNPHVKLDRNKNITPALMDFLENQKEFVKDGNLKLNGVLFKVAPTLTKFNPNFRGREAGKKPMSRGLTQGGIIQFASKALAKKVISSPASAKSWGRSKKAADSIHNRKRQKSSEHASFMMQGTKKPQLLKRSKKEDAYGQQSFNEDIGSSVGTVNHELVKAKGLAAEKSNYISPKSINKIQGGGELGNDKVELNVQFKSDQNMGQRVISQQLSQCGQSTTLAPSRNAGPYSGNPNQILVQNDSHVDSMTHKELTDRENETEHMHNPRASNTSCSPPARNQKLLQSPRRNGDSKPPTALRKNRSFRKSRASEGPSNATIVGAQDPLRIGGEEGFALRRSQVLPDDGLSNFDKLQAAEVDMEQISSGPIEQVVELAGRQSQLNRTFDATPHDGGLEQIPKNSGSRNGHQHKLFETYKIRESNNLKKKRSQAAGNKSSSGTQIRKGQPIKDFIKHVQQREKFAPQSRTEVVSSPTNAEDRRRFEDIQIMSLSNVNFKDFEQAVCGVERIVSGSNVLSQGRMATSPRILNQELTLSNAEEAELADINLCKTLQAMSEEKMKTDTIENSLSARDSDRPQNEVAFANDRQQKLGEAQVIKDTISIGQVTKLPICSPVADGTKSLSLSAAASAGGTPMEMRNPEKAAHQSNRVLDPQHPSTKETTGVAKLGANNNKRVILSTSQTGKSGTSGAANIAPQQQQHSIDQNYDTIRIQGDSKHMDSPTPREETRENHTVTASQAEGTAKSHYSDPIEVNAEDEAARPPDPAEQIEGHQHHMMSPKGINLQNHSVPVSVNRVDKCSRPNFIKVQEQPGDDIDNKPGNNRISECNNDAGRDSGLEPRTSYLYTSSQLDSQRDTAIIDQEELNDIIQTVNEGGDKPGIKRQKTQAWKQKKAKMERLGVREVAAMDIDKAEYTEQENDSNAYQGGHSELMREAEAQEKRGSGPEKGKRGEKGQNRAHLEPRPSKEALLYSTIPHFPASLKVKVSEATDAGASHIQSIVGTPLRTSLGSQSFAKSNAHATNLDPKADQQRAAGHHTVRSADFDGNYERTQDAGDLSNFTEIGKLDRSQKVSVVLSESLLDCRDIGTGPLDGEGLDRLTSNSEEMLQRSIVDRAQQLAHRDNKNTGAVTDYQNLKDAYKPIQQVNVLLLNQEQKTDESENKNDQSFKNVFYENNKAASNAILTNQKIRNGMNHGSYKPNEEMATGVSRNISRATMQQSNIQADMQCFGGYKSSYPKYRQRQLFDYLGQKRRIILKSPNPNDAKKVLLAGSNIQLEADTLLNGKIYSHEQSKRLYSPSDQKQLNKTQFNRQTKLESSEVKKDLALNGKHFDTHDQKVAKMQALQSELNNLSVEQLQHIYQYLINSGQIQIQQNGLKLLPGNLRQNIRIPTTSPTYSQSDAQQIRHSNQHGGGTMSKRDLLSNPDIMSFMKDLMSYNQILPNQQANQESNHHVAVIVHNTSSEDQQIAGSSDPTQQELTHFIGQTFNNHQTMALDQMGTLQPSRVQTDLNFSTPTALHPVSDLSANLRDKYRPNAPNEKGRGSGLGVHKKASVNVNRLPNNTLLSLDDQETDKQTVYLTAQQTNLHHHAHQGVVSYSPNSKFSNTYRLNSQHMESIKLNRPFSLEEQDTLAGEGTVTNSFNKEIQPLSVALKFDKDLVRRHKHESFKVSPVKLDRLNRFLPLPMHDGKNSETRFKTVTNSRERQKDNADSQTQMTIIGETNHDAELIMGTSSILSSQKNLNNAHKAKHQGELADEQTLSGQYSDKIITQMMQRKESASFVADHQKLQNQHKVDYLSKMNKDLQYIDQTIIDGPEASPPRGETFMANRLKLQGKQSTLFAQPQAVNQNRLINIQSQHNPNNNKVVQSFTPDHDLLAGGYKLNQNVHINFNKVQKLAAEIQVSKKFSPDDILSGIPLNRLSTTGYQHHRSTIGSPQSYPKRCERRNIMSQNGIGIKTLAPNSSLPVGTQRLNKKTVAHSDIAHYEKYMQMKRVQSQIQSHNENLFRYEPFARDNHRSVVISDKDEIKKIKQTESNCFFNQVSKKMKEVFSPMGQTIESQRMVEEDRIVMSSKNIGFSSRRSNIIQSPLSASKVQQQKNTSLKKDLRKSHRTSKSRDQATRFKGKQISNKNGSDASPTNNQNRGSISPISNQGLYQQSFLPANRMIQQQKYRQQQEKIYQQEQQHQFSNYLANNQSKAQPSSNVTNNDIRSVDIINKLLYPNNNSDCSNLRLEPRSYIISRDWQSPSAYNRNERGESRITEDSQDHRSKTKVSNQNHNFLQEMKTHIMLPKQYQDIDNDKQMLSQEIPQEVEIVKMVVNGKSRTNLIMINGP